jgi:hypothetical protein
MRRMLSLCLLQLCVLNAGCRLAVYTTQNIINEPRRLIADTTELSRDRRLANAAWEEVHKANPEVPYSKDYIEGFKAGFVDYLKERGQGPPSPLPPPRYWTTRYETPAGVAAARDWLAGFEQGAQAAHASGIVAVLKPPTLLSPPGPPPMVSVAVPPDDGLHELPPPRKVQEPAGQRAAQAEQPSAPWKSRELVPGEAAKPALPDVAPMAPGLPLDDLSKPRPHVESFGGEAVPDAGIQPGTEPGRGHQPIR